MKSAILFGSAGALLGLLTWAVSAQQSTQPTPRPPQIPGQVQQPTPPNPPVAQPQPNTQPRTQPGTAAQPGVQPGANANQGTRVQGKVVRVGENQFAIQTNDNRNLIFYTNDRTRYMRNNAAVRFNDIQVGMPITAWYTTEGERFWVNNVDLGAAAVGTQPVQPVTPVPQPAPGGSTTFYEGQVVRVVGQNEVVIRTSDGKEITIFVTPQTTYRFNDQPATLTAVQPNIPVRVDYDVRDGRHYARGIFGLRRR
jgi:hypothetical protein